MPFGDSQRDVPKGQLKIAQRFNAGAPRAPRQVPKGRLKEGAGGCVQSSLRDSNWNEAVPGVETPYVFTVLSRCVAAAILAAVEGGILPPGMTTLSEELAAKPA